MPQANGATTAVASIMMSNNNWVVSSQERLVPNLSTCGPQRNLIIHGRPNSEVSPIDSRETFMSLKNSDERVRIIVKGKPSVK